MCSWFQLQAPAAQDMLQVYIAQHMVIRFPKDRCMRPGSFSKVPVDTLYPKEQPEPIEKSFLLAIQRRFARAGSPQMVAVPRWLIPCTKRRKIKLRQLGTNLPRWWFSFRAEWQIEHCKTSLNLFCWSSHFKSHFVFFGMGICAATGRFRSLVNLCSVR